MIFAGALCRDLALRDRTGVVDGVRIATWLNPPVVEIATGQVVEARFVTMHGILDVSPCDDRYAYRTDRTGD